MMDSGAIAANDLARIVQISPDCPVRSVAQNAMRSIHGLILRTCVWGIRRVANSLVYVVGRLYNKVPWTAIPIAEVTIVQEAFPYSAQYIAVTMPCGDVVLP